jgi:hypothetical protein
MLVGVVQRAGLAPKADDKLGELCRVPMMDGRAEWRVGGKDLQ